MKLMKDEDLKANIKSSTRAYFITLDFLLQKLKKDGVFENFAFNPIGGKIDPFDLENFNCEPKLFKKEKMMEFCSKGISKYKLTKNLSTDRESALAVMDTITKEIFSGIDNSYQETKGKNYAKFTMFSFFNLNVDSKFIDQLSDSQKNDLLEIMRNDSSPFIGDTSFGDVTERRSFEEILSNPDYCSSTLLFCFMDLKSSIFGGLNYNLKNGYISLKEGKESFYNSLVFSYGEGYDQNRCKVASILPISESSINLVDL